MYSKKLSFKEIVARTICIYGITLEGEKILKICKDLRLENVYFIISDDHSIPYRFKNGIMVLHLSETRAIESPCIFVLSLNKNYHDEIAQKITGLYPEAVVFSGNEWEDLIEGMKREWLLPS